jgi:hypothetical protein
MSCTRRTGHSCPERVLKAGSVLRGGSCVWRACLEGIDLLRRRNCCCSSSRGRLRTASLTRCRSLRSSRVRGTHAITSRSSLMLYPILHIASCVKMLEIGQGHRGTRVGRVPTVLCERGFRRFFWKQRASRTGPSVHVKRYGETPDGSQIWAARIALSVVRLLLPIVGAQGIL